MSSTTADPDAAVFLTISQAATRLQVHRRTVERMVNDGRLPLYRINKSSRLVRVKAADIDALAEQVPSHILF